jgi:peptide/nickel transport system substrate-binding protein
MADQALSDLESGNFQFVQCNSRKLDSVIQNNPRFQLFRSDSLFLKYLSYDLARDQTPFCNVQPNPLRNKLVRQALNVGIDRKQLVSGLSTYAAPATQLVPPFIFGYNPSIQLPENNLQKARELLKQAGLPNGFHVTLHARLMFQEAAMLLRQQLLPLGIDAEVKVLQDREFFDALDKQKVTLFLSRLGCTTGDVSDILDNSLHSIDKNRHFGWHNYAVYNNPEVDSLIEQSNEISHIELRKSSLQHIMSLLMEDLVWIPLYIDQDVYAVDRAFHWSPRNDSFIVVSEIRTH